MNISYLYADCEVVARSFLVRILVLAPYSVLTNIQRLCHARRIAKTKKQNNFRINFMGKSREVRVLKKRKVKSTERMKERCDWSCIYHKWSCVEKKGRERRERGGEWYKKSIRAARGARGTQTSRGGVIGSHRCKTSAGEIESFGMSWMLDF